MIRIMLPLLLLMMTSTAVAMEEESSDESRKSSYTEFSVLIPKSPKKFRDRLAINDDYYSEKPVHFIIENAPSKKNPESRCKTITWASILAIGFLAPVGSTIGSLNGLSTINAIACPITAYPLEFGHYPIIPHRPNCTYTNYNQGSSPYIYKGECACIRGQGCKCVLEECPGSAAYRQAYTLLTASLGVGLSITIIATVVGVLNLFIK